MIAAVTEERTLQTGDGTSIFYRSWPVEAARGAVLIVHGYAEHSGRYHHVAGALNANGLSVIAPDLRGHGRSEGIRGHVHRFSDYQLEIQLLYELLAREHPGLPLFILGHSNGGLIALSYALDQQPGCRGLIISSPFLGTAAPVPGGKALLGRILSRLAPSVRIPSGLSPRNLSRDATVGEAYAADPLVFPTVTPGFFSEAQATQARVQSEAARIKLPCLVLQAEDDRIANPNLSRPLFDRLGSTDKSYIGYPGFYHEIFNENGKEKVLGDMCGWLAARL